MRASVVKNRIHVTLEGDVNQIDMERKLVWDTIGSASSQSDGVTVSCALSIANFRKLKSFGCSLSKDEKTLGVVSQMMSNLKEYEAESESGKKVKDGLATYDRDYKFKVAPFPHQVIGFNFLHAMKPPAMFGDCGTGKTYMVLTFAESLVQKEKIFFLVLCPVNLITNVWIEETLKFTDLSVLSLRDTPSKKLLASDWSDGADKGDSLAKAEAKASSEKRHKEEVKLHYQADVDVYVVNFEIASKKAHLDKIIKLCKRRIDDGYQMCLAIDESSKIKSHTSLIYKASKKLRAMSDRCIIMTGTPSPNGAADLWAQFSVLDDGMTLQPAHNDFRWDTHNKVTVKNVKSMRGKDLTLWKPKGGIGHSIYRQIEPRMIRFKGEDVIDIPGKTFNVRSVEMNQDQKSAYKDMEKMLFAEIEGESVTAKISAVKLMKLREITGGFVMDDSGKTIELGKDSPKMLELDDLLEQSVAPKMGDEGPPNKALIWANYQWECKTLVKRYRKYGARGLFGGISKTAKDDAIAKFRRDPDCRVLVCHPASAGHGLTLVEANYAFYYSLSYNFEEFYQSYKRIIRPGQTRRTAFYFLVCHGTIDKTLLSVLRDKKNFSDIITDGGLPDVELIRLKSETWDI